MIQKIRAAVVLVMVGAAGCGPLNMAKSGATAQESERDKTECNQEAALKANSMGLQTEIGVALQKRISLKDCLAARGYKESSEKDGAANKVASVPLKTNTQSVSSASGVQSTENEPGLIKIFSGSGVMTTRPFTAPPKWEMQWKSEGGVFGIYLKDGEGNMLAVPASQSGPGSGSAYQPAGGEFILQIIATDPWTVKVVKVEN